MIKLLLHSQYEVMSENVAEEKCKLANIYKAVFENILDVLMSRRRINYSNDSIMPSNRAPRHCLE